MPEKYIFIVIKYPRADTGMQALAALLDYLQMGIVGLQDGVAVTKTGEGEVRLHRSPDYTAGKGFLNGGLIGNFFADLYGVPGWDSDRALAGTASSMLEQGIKDLLLDEFGDRMTFSESAVVFLVEQVDWPSVGEQRRVDSLGEAVVISQPVMGDLTIGEKQVVQEEVTSFVPAEMESHASKGVIYIEGIGEAYGAKLVESGIKNIDDLLEKGSTRQGREKLAEATGISGKLLLRWINMADLFRIKGIGEEYSELLEAAGVDTVPELAQRVPANLLEKMASVNAARKMVRRLPDLPQVESWVAQAKSLPRVITY